MKLKDISKEELEMMGYDDLAVIILNESKKKMKIADIFKKICKALGLSDAEYENNISEFFEIVSTNKLFTILPQGYCDLKARHNTKAVILEDEEDIQTEEDASDEDEIIEENEEDEDIFYDEESDDDIEDDDLQDFVVIDEDEEANS
jgi:DNA-directed RNA polymerase delta subunit